MGKEESKKEEVKSSKASFISKHFLYFIMYAMIGWIYEVVLEVFIYHWGYSNRGVLFGPYCPVYGFGALAFIFTVYPMIKKKKFWEKLLYIPLVFILCMLIATALELLTSYLCELFMGSWPWQTYATSYPGTNFQGRIALSPSIRFGIGGTVFLYVLQPLFEKFTTKLEKKEVKINAGILLAIMVAMVILCDGIYTFSLKPFLNNYLSEKYQIEVKI